MARRIGSDGARTRCAIREAATRLIARYGYEALSMRRLGKEIGLGAAALYRYFPNKQAILFDLLKTHMDELLAAWSAANPGPTRKARERLEAFTRFHIRYHFGHADSLFLSYMELRSLTPENFRAIEDLRRAYEREIADIVEAGITEGVLRPQNPRVTARALIALINGLPAWFRPNGALGPDEIEELYVTMAIGLAGAPQSKETACFTPA